MTTPEFELINTIRLQQPAHPSIPLGIGDDGAIVKVSPRREVVVVTDMLLDGVHFRLDQIDAALAAGEGLHRRVAVRAGGPLDSIARAFDTVREQLASRTDARQLLGQGDCGQAIQGVLLQHARVRQRDAAWRGLGYEGLERGAGLGGDQRAGRLGGDQQPERAGVGGRGDPGELVCVHPGQRRDAGTG